MDIKAIENLATSWVNSWMEDPKKTCHDLIISKLDGVRVSVKILLMDTCVTPVGDGVWLRLLVETVFHIDENCDGEPMYYNLKEDKNTLHHAGKKVWDVELMCASIISIIKMIGLLKYNKMKDGFTIGDEYKNMWDVEFEIWSVNKNTEINGDICCVCHDRTTSETECGHHLCQQCWCLLKREQQYGEKGHICPVCRKFMSYVL